MTCKTNSKALTIESVRLKSIVLGFLLFISCNCLSQDWARLFGDGGNCEGHSIALDSSGNIIVAGHVADTLMITGIDTVITNYPMPPWGQTSFVMKLTANGDLVWFKPFYCQATGLVTLGEWSATPHHIDIDQDDNIYLGSNYYSDLVLDEFQATAPVQGYLNFFVSKLSSEGEMVWTKTSDLGGEWDHYVAELECGNDGTVEALIRNDGDISIDNQTITGTNVMEFSAADGSLMDYHLAGTDFYPNPHLMSFYSENGYFIGHFDRVFHFQGFGGLSGELEVPGAENILRIKSVDTHQVIIAFSVDAGSSTPDDLWVTLYDFELDDFLWTTYLGTSLRCQDLEVSDEGKVFVSYIDSDVPPTTSSFCRLAQIIEGELISDYHLGFPADGGSTGSSQLHDIAINDTSIFYTGRAAGSYNLVFALDTLQGWSVSDIVVGRIDFSSLGTISAIDNLSQFDLEVTISPNPATDVVHVEISSATNGTPAPIEFSLISPLGKEVQSGHVLYGRNTIDLSHRTSGWYVLRLENNNTNYLILKL